MKSSNTTHADLIDLEGFFVYYIQSNIEDFDFSQTISVNNKKFSITYHEDDTGLNVINATNTETGEVSIIFAGSATDKDWEQNILNGLDYVPEQFESGRKYVDQQLAKGVNNILINELLSYNSTGSYFFKPANA